MAIGEICNRKVVFTRRGDTVLDAARLMREHHVGCVVVVDEGQERRVPVGMVTDRDIVVGVVAKGLDAAVLCVGDVMGGEVVSIAESAGVAETIELMRSRGVRRVPVVDAAGALVGLVAVDDVIELLAEEMGAVARLVAREQRNEAAKRTV